MRKILGLLLVFTFTLTMAATAVNDVGKVKAENVVSFQIDSEGFVCDWTIEGLTFNNDYELNLVENGIANVIATRKTKEKQTYLRKGRNVDYSTHGINDTYSNKDIAGKLNQAFDYSINKILMQS